jgi:zinc transport system ATP-binding protein
MEKNELLSVDNLTVEFDNHKIIDKVSFSVGKNETLAVIGPNGAGKSVLFRALLGLIPYEGNIKWAAGVKIGYVPQKLSVSRDLPLTTLEFLQLKEKNRKEVLKVLGEVGFAENIPHKEHLSKHILKRKIGVLSGGEFQRVLIAFALLGNPDVLLFDEPTAGIDALGEETIYTVLHKLQEQRHLTIILISHELQIVYKYADTVFCLNHEKVCFGPPRQVLDKENLARLYGEEVGFYQHHSGANA